MKIFYLLILAGAMNTNLFAQDEAKPEARSKKFGIGVFYALDRNLGPDHLRLSEYTGYSVEYDKRNYRAGVSIEYALNQKLRLNTGLSYSNKEFTGSYYCAVCLALYAPWPIDMGLEFIEIPIGIKQYLFASTIDAFVDVGFVNQISINHKSLPVEHSGEEIHQNRFVLSAKIGAGLAYNFKNDLAIQWSTEYNRSLSDVYKQTEYDLSFLSFKLQAIKTL